MKRARWWLCGIVVLLFLAACTWVKISPEMSKVRVFTADEVAAAGCERLGVTSVATIATYGMFDRYSKSVDEELSALARGSAVDMDGNAIVPQSEVVDGRRTYVIYRCPPQK